MIQAGMIEFSSSLQQYQTFHLVSHMTACAFKPYECLFALVCLDYGHFDSGVITTILIDIRKNIKMPLCKLVTAEHNKTQALLITMT